MNRGFTESVQGQDWISERMRNRENKKRILVGVLTAVILIAMFGAGLFLIEKRGIVDEQFGDTGGWGDDEDEEILITLDDMEYVTDDNIDTYLLIGTDAGTENQGTAYSGQLADFLTLLLVDNTTQKYAFIEIDRNTMVDVQILDEAGEFSTFFNEQICLSRWYGADEEQRNLNTLAAVSALFGYMDIDNYYTINMEDIGLINDVIGGVTVEIQTDLTSVDPAFVKGATVHLDSEQAEKFVRARMNVGDGTNKERMARQTQYMKSAYNMVIERLRQEPEFFNDVYNQLSSKIEKGETDSTISVLTNQLVQYDNLGILQIDGETRLGDTQGDGIEHEEFYADNASIVKILESIMNLTSRPVEYDDEEDEESGEYSGEDGVDLEGIEVIESDDEAFDEALEGDEGE